MSRTLAAHSAGAAGPVWEAAVARTHFVFVDGASASGKSTLKDRLLRDRDVHFAYARRYTTRPPRAGDDATDDYFFIGREEFDRMVGAGDLIEYRDFLFGMSYGIGRQVLLEAAAQADQVLAVMNLGSVASVKQSIPPAICLLIDAPLGSIERRLCSRGVHSEDQIRERLENARTVSRMSAQYDYVFENADNEFDRAYAKLKSYLKDQRKIP